MIDILVIFSYIFHGNIGKILGWYMENDANGVKWSYFDDLMESNDQYWDI